MITWRMAAAWITALVVATVLTWQIVGLADSQVGETPIAVAPSLTTSSTGGPSTTSGPPSPSTTDDSAPTAAPSPDPSSQTPPTTSSTEPSSSPSTSSTMSTSPTSSAESWSLRTITTTGGVVVVRYRTGEVVLQAATPSPGFSVEVDDAGPPRVRVEFESETSEARVEARWERGSLDIDIDD